MKILKFFFAIFSICTIVSASTFTPEIITAELNATPIVTSGGVTIPYFHDPITCGDSIFQGEKKIKMPGTGKNMLYTSGIATCQILVIRNPVTHQTGLFHFDQFFNGEGIAETLADFAAGEAFSKLNVRIVINQNIFNLRGDADFRSGYGRGIDEHLAFLSSKFEAVGVTPEILRISSVNIEERLRNFLKDDAEYKDISPFKLAYIFAQLSLNSTASVCVDVTTGELSWWSIPLSRVYSPASSKNLIENFYELRMRKQQECNIRSMIMAASALRYSLSDMMQLI